MFSGDQLTPVNASMSSVYHSFGNHYSAGRCMDGEHEGYFSSCQTEKELAPWIAFDFGKEVEVGSVVISGGGNEGEGDIMNLDVRMTAFLPEDGDSKFSAGTLLGSFNSTLEQCQRILIKSPIPRKGRFVFIQMSHGTADHLWFQEVAVFGPKEEVLPGTFFLIG